MDNHVRFITKKYRMSPAPNPEEHAAARGTELAYWLCLELAKLNIATSYPRYEDWGWFVEYTSVDGDIFWLCGGVRDERENEWHCYIQPLAPSFMRRRKVAMENAGPLLEGLTRILDREPAIEEVIWWEDH